ncbi:MAG: TonB family protein [Bdellovibrionales bacterium]|nr:TonB family protein [Bdellovibrionales bacterium]
MDKSFEGLLFSLAIHALLVVAFFNMPSKPFFADGDRTEITLIEKPQSKAKAFVTETEKQKPPELVDVKDAADYLSEFTKRVKKQIVARNSGPTRNSQPTVIPLRPKEVHDRGRVAGMDTQPRARREEGVGLPTVGGNQSMREVAIGPSSVAEFIPGVEQGEFTALNTDQFTYYSFFARINEQIRNRWVTGIRNYMAQLSTKDHEMLSKIDRQTVVEIILTPNGEFSSSVLEHSSGDRVLDQTTVDAFRAAAPFLNPPRGIVESDGFIHLRYGFVVRFRPPLGQAGF